MVTASTSRFGRWRAIATSRRSVELTDAREARPAVMSTCDYSQTTALMAGSSRRMAHASSGREVPLLSIGVVIALPQEARMFARALHEANEVARVDPHLLVCVGGVGPDCAQTAARLLLARGASALISWGVAAALIPDLKSGSLLLPQTVVGAHGELFSVTASWHRHMQEASFDTRPIAEAASMLAIGAQKRALGDTTHAVAVDMESASVARVAHQAGVPFLVVRAVADDLETALPAWLTGCFDAYGRMRGWRFLAQVLRHPHDILAVARLARAFAAAENSLRRFKTKHLQHPLILA